MTALETIISTIDYNMKSVSLHKEYSNKPGLYAFSLAKGSSLKEFGKANQIIYVGKAEDSLKQRDFNTHFKNGKTGQSTLRRSIGAILKKDFNATAFSRNGTCVPPNIDNYKFDSNSEAKLSEWMNDNLLVGYWEYNKAIETKTLRAIEVELIKILKPTLDLDRQTRIYNILAETLQVLRKVCKEEATLNVTNGIKNF